MSSDQYVSAVVTLRPDDQQQDPEQSVENPEAVAAEGAAIVAGSASVPHLAGRRTARAKDVPVPAKGSAASRAKGYFTDAGFEVHAPLGATFSIGAPRSRFESFFGEPVVIDEEQIGGAVTNEAGGRDLPVEQLPDAVRVLIADISLPPPNDFFAKDHEPLR